MCRKTLADSRPRVRGRFARNDDAGAVMPHETKKAQAAARRSAAAQAAKGAGARPPQPGLVCSLAVLSAEASAASCRMRC